MANTVRIRGVFDDGISHAVGGLQGQFRKLEDAVKSRDLKPILTGVGLGLGEKAFEAFGEAVGGAVDFLKDSIRVFEEDERSQAALRASLLANVSAWDGNAEAIDRAIEANLRYGFTAKEQRDALTRLVAATHDVNKALALERTAMDLARMRGIDLASASDVLVKVYAGNVGALRRLGIAIDKNASSTEALAQVQRIAGGQAEAYAQTVEGKLAVAQAHMEEAQVRFGRVVAPMVADGMLTIADAAEKLSTEMEAVGRAIGPVVNAAGGLDRIVGGLVNAFNPLAGATAAYTQQLQQLIDEHQRAQAAASAWRDRLVQANADGRPAIEGLAGAANDLADGEDSAAAGAQKMAREVKRTVPTVQDAKRSWEDLGSAVAEAIFGPAILAGREAGLQRRLREIKDEMKKERDPLRIKELKGDIADTESQLVETRLKLALLGDQTEKDKLVPWIKSAIGQMDQFDTSTQAAIRDIARLMGLSAQLSGMPTPFTIRARQHGGPVTAGQAYLVGERGPELFVPAMSGRIIAHAPAGGPDRVVVHTQINLDGRRLAEVVDEHLGWRYATAARTTRPV